MDEVRVPGTNTGHGHVWKRPDGKVYRCGGPRMCKKCAADAELVAGLKKAAEDEVHELRRAVAEVRALHFQYRGVGSPPDSCAHCNQLAGYEVPWPCPTIQALDRAGEVLDHQDVGPPRYFDGGVQRTTHDPKFCVLCRSGGHERPAEVIRKECDEP